MTKKDMFDYCLITKSSAEIKNHFNVFTKKNYCEGSEIYADAIYSPCRCVVTDLLKYNDHLGLIIQYSENISFRFLHMKEIVVKESNTIITGQLLGYADKYVHVEYLTSEVAQVGLQVTIPPDICLYKHNPEFILNGQIRFDESPISMQNVGLYQALMEDGRGPEEYL